MLEHLIEYFSRHIFSYILVFLALFLTGIGLPVPEDIILFAAGYVTAKDFAILEIMIPISMISILGSDTLMYALGRMFGERVFKWKIVAYFFTEKRLNRIRYFYERYGKRTVFIARFTPGLRSWVYIFAGTVKMRLGYFILMDFFAAIISVPLFIWIGYYFNNEIDKIAIILVEVKEWIFVGILTVILIILIRHFILKRSKSVNSSEV
jgi:membrane protein DedA with SNARE-associated domain